MTTTSPFTKTYTPSFEQDGRKRHFVGILGQLTDGSGLLLFSQIYDDKQTAETALNDLVRELLTDYCERGLVDTVPAVELVNWNGATARCPTCDDDGDCPDCGLVKLVAA